MYPTHPLQHPSSTPVPWLDFHDDASCELLPTSYLSFMDCPLWPFLSQMLVLLQVFLSARLSCSTPLLWDVTYSLGLNTQMKMTVKFIFDPWFLSTSPKLYGYIPLPRHLPLAVHGLKCAILILSFWGNSVLRTEMKLTRAKVIQSKICYRWKSDLRITYHW